MRMESVTTPFGRRPMSLALVKRQVAFAKINPGKSADKWKVFRDASAAMKQLGIQPNSLAVLDALLSFHPTTELRQDAQLIVFPSNVQLSLRAHQMAGATVRRHIALLVEAGLIVRKDSANGKRYARKDGAGEIRNAFGFDLSPLLARSEELALMAQQVITERAAFKTAKENLTICRRNVRKLIAAAIEEGADGDWRAIEETYLAVVRRLPRSPSMHELAAILSEMELLQREIINRLENQENIENKSSNDAPIEQHIQNSKPELSIDLEKIVENGQKFKATSSRQQPSQGLKGLPLDMVLRACPLICDYGPGGQVRNWRDLMSAAVVARSTLGVTPSAYQHACEIMGAENAATSIACILERSNLIASAGGYLRDLTRRAEMGKFSLGSMVMALLKSASKTAVAVTVKMT